MLQSLPNCRGELFGICLVTALSVHVDLPSHYDIPKATTQAMGFHISRFPCLYTVYVVSDKTMIFTRFLLVKT